MDSVEGALDVEVVRETALADNLVRFDVLAIVESKLSAQHEQRWTLTLTLTLTLP